jgi:hypothetical protein
MQQAGQQMLQGQRRNVCHKQGYWYSAWRVGYHAAGRPLRFIRCADVSYCVAIVVVVSNMRHADGARFGAIVEQTKSSCSLHVNTYINLASCTLLVDVYTAHDTALLELLPSASASPDMT